MTTDPQTVATAEPVDAASEFAAGVAADAPPVATDKPADPAAEAKARKDKADKIREAAFKAVEEKPKDSDSPEVDAGDKGDEDTQAVSEQPRDGEGKFAAKAEDTPERRESLAVARMALRRDQWTAEEIAELKPETLIALGEKARKRQSEQDAMGARMAAALREKQTKTDEPKPNSQPATRSQLDDLLAEIDGEDPETEEAPKPEPEPSTRSGGESKELAQARAELALTRIGNAERELLNDFPGLKDDVNRTKLAAVMQRLDPTHSALKSQEGITQLMTEACFVVFGKELKAQNEQSRRERVQRARTVVDSQPDIESRPAVSPRTLSKDQIRKAAFEASGERDPGKADEKFKKLKGQAASRR